MKSIEIPASVSSIGVSAFSSNQLTSISVDAGNPYYDSRDNCNAIIWTLLNQLIQASSNTFIPNTVTSIASYAFSNIQIHSELIIPNSITSIGSLAFYECGILSISIPNSVVSIEYSAFQNCSLRKVTISSSVSSIGSGAFYNLPLDSVFMLGDTPPTLGDHCFRSCYNAKFYVPCGSSENYRNNMSWADAYYDLLVSAKTF